MQTVELCAQDRARIDEMIESVTRSQRKFKEVVVTCTEAARLLNRTPTTVSTMLREKRLHKITLGASTGIALSEIERMLNRREAGEP
jgi:hypothetical protein